MSETINYKVMIMCKNCSYGHFAVINGNLIKIKKGTRVNQVKCPNCKCKELIRID